MTLILIIVCLVYGLTRKEYVQFETHYFDEMSNQSLRHHDGRPPIIAYKNKNKYYVFMCSNNLDHICKNWSDQSSFKKIAILTLQERYCIISNDQISCPAIIILAEYYKGENLQFDYTNARRIPFFKFSQQNIFYSRAIFVYLFILFNIFLWRKISQRHRNENT